MIKEVGMPPVPKKIISRDEFAKYEHKSGIYFAWKNRRCVYVGKSVNLGKRLCCAKHEKIQDCNISILEMEEDDIHRSELYYIWALKPERNNETSKSKVKKGTMQKI